ncbi:MAG: hypothetical protein JXR83_03315, partial [Deltaproteobacteria bacterium]|nr:hypothetical protein [Deltaproteobacteria bacterium]
PIRFISIGVKYELVQEQGFEVLKETAAEWYEGFGGQLTGLIMLLALATVCFLLARWGAKSDLKARGVST